MGESAAAAMNRWWREHGELDRRIDAVLAAIEGGSLARVSADLEELASAFEEHFDEEESVYFPLISGLSSRHQSVVGAASLAHRKIRDRVDQARKLINDGELAPARRDFSVLLDRFRTHEAMEAKLIAEITRELEEEKTGASGARDRGRSA